MVSIRCKNWWSESFCRLHPLSLFLENLNKLAYFLMKIQRFKFLKPLEGTLTFAFNTLLAKLVAMKRYLLVVLWEWPFDSFALKPQERQLSQEPQDITTKPVDMGHIMAWIGYMSIPLEETSRKLTFGQILSLITKVCFTLSKILVAFSSHFMRRGTHLFILLKKYAWYVNHVYFNAYLLSLF